MKRLIRKAVRTVTVEELFKEKYPTGSITKKSGGKYEVAFTEGGKVYSYRASNNIDIIEKLKLTDDNLMYQYTYDSYARQIQEHEDMIAKLQNGEDAYDDWFISDEDKTEEEKEKERQDDIKSRTYDLNCLKEKIKNAIIVK